MCLSVFLLADRPLPVPPDPATYPGLQLQPVGSEWQSETLDGIERVAPAVLAYNLSPAGYCGCYFGYETPEEFQAAMEERAIDPGQTFANTPKEAEMMWRSRMDAVHSLGRYLAAHPEAGLALYAVWEHRAGQVAPVHAEVPPSYFGGPGFARLPEDILLTIVREPAVGENLLWDSAARRDHDWIGCQSVCGLPGDDDDDDSPLTAPEAE